ncbi:hypothetical protein ARMGADRAFT_1079802 [Armillaria gallica]|uniref:LOB domain-containing protein n=1 Tax=Armillaria gallica TaxID=47427 RepID=A0A2H3DWL7_ARMGA|nr:hypothetical protein ARMGADRAFT_1079802 [Armillaria gallica]
MPIFHKWAATSLTIISNAEAAACHQFSSLPDHYASSLHGMMTTINIEQQCEHLAHSEQYKTLSMQIESLTSMVTTDILPKGPHGQSRCSLHITATFPPACFDSSMAPASQAAVSVPETSTLVFDSALQPEPPMLSDPVSSSDNVSSSITDLFLMDTSNLLHFH